MLYLQKISGDHVGRIQYREVRKEIREQIIGDVLWSYASDAGSPHLAGTIIDVSKSGLSIFIHKQVEEGDILKITGEGLWEGPRFAIVRWCREIAPDIYRAGLFFNYKDQ